jgi:multiple sugar transport system permease protein
MSGGFLMKKDKNKKSPSYAKWGYIFVASFFVVYLLFTFIPQVLTIYDSFFDYSDIVGTLENIVNFCGFKNYKMLFSVNMRGDIELLRCLGNTIIIWVIGAIPQMLFGLLLALIFTSTKLRLKGQGFFKTVFYMPNLIMAAAFASLILALFGTIGPFHTLFVENGWIAQTFDFISDKTWARILIAFMNFLMWFGNTTILLMAGIQGIDDSVFESAKIDGASSSHVLWDITLPLLKPISVYVLVTSMIGGLQMFDVAQVLTGKAKNNSTRTIVMLINDYLVNGNYGHAGAVSVILFIITAALSIFVFKSINRKGDEK